LISSVGATTAATVKGRKSRQLIVCCDGTWIAPERGYPSHVGRIAQLAAMRDLDENDRDLVFYSRGVGTRYWFDKFPGGSTGEGLESDVKDAYNFLAHNYVPPDEHYDGDEIYLFGFSRGAFTVRCVAAMVSKVGLLRRSEVGQLGRAWSMYREVPPPAGREDSPDRDKFEDSQVHRANINFLGVFDTVGAKGVPLFGFDQTPKFRDRKLPKRVLHARHAIGINEPRSIFVPTVWDGAEPLPLNGDTSDIAPDPNTPQRIKQVWFAGVHSDIGGGYDRFDLEANGHLGRFTLEWMLAEARACGFDFHEERAAEMVNQLKPSHTHDNYDDDDHIYELHDSMSIAYWLMDKVLFFRRILRQQDLRYHRRYIKNSCAIDQSLHESAANMYRLDQLHERGEGVDERRILLTHKWSIRPRPRRFRFSRNCELHKIESQIPEQVSVAEDFAAPGSATLIPLEDGREHQAHTASVVFSSALYAVTVLAVLGALVVLAWTAGDALHEAVGGPSASETWDWIKDAASDVVNWLWLALVLAVAFALVRAGLSLYLKFKRLYTYRLLR
jgi:uncharacterized protein (DUF2235 family)